MSSMSIKLHATIFLFISASWIWTVRSTTTVSADLPAWFQCWWGHNCTHSKKSGLSVCCTFLFCTTHSGSWAKLICLSSIISVWKYKLTYYTDPNGHYKHSKMFLVYYPDGATAANWWNRGFMIWQFWVQTLLLPFWISFFQIICPLCIFVQPSYC